MKNSEFAIWVKGYMDLCPATTLTQKKLHILRNHLNLVKAVEGYFTEASQRIYTLLTQGLETKNADEFENIKQALFGEITYLLPE